MTELDVAHFRKPLKELPTDPKAKSVEAPVRPESLVHPIQAEILPPVPIKPQVNVPVLRRINFDRVHSRHELMQELNQTLTLNEYGLPRFIYRADLLDHDLLLRAHRSAALPISTPSTQLQEAQSALESATLYLDYDHGYPTFKNGMPFWSQLEFETADAYAAFENYLALMGARSFRNVIGYDPDSLVQWYHTNCWALRAGAYDMYKTVHHNRLRAQRIMATEDKHYLESEKLFNKVAKVLGNKTDEELGLLEVDKLVGVMDKVHKIQRVSAGLPTTGGLNAEDAPQTLSVEVQMRHIAQTSGNQKAQEDDSDISSILQDPEMLNIAQELSIKVTKSK